MTAGEALALEIEEDERAGGISWVGEDLLVSGEAEGDGSDGGDRSDSADGSDGGDDQRVARAALTYLAEPGDPALAAVLRYYEPAEVVAGIQAGHLPRTLNDHAQGDGVSRRSLERALARWRSRIAEIPDQTRLDAFGRVGIRLVCPGEPEWPTQLDALGEARPYALWLRGSADLRFCCLRSVSVVGARAATAYGSHVCAEMAAELGEHGWAVVSGGAYGIDACAHRGALAVEGVTIAVLACGVDHPYPAGNKDLLDAVAAQGVVVSEWPPGRTPTRLRFLVRNRVIAALTRGTVVVEAAERSGALNTARHARDLYRPLMAVPGPVTSEFSAGCHKIIREWGAVCVTGSRDVMELLSPIGEIMAPITGESPGATMRDGTEGLDLDCARVLEALPIRMGAGPAKVAVSAGVDLDTVLRCLGLLAASGFAERTARGWRLRRR
jgi:DNA processing protein